MNQLEKSIENFTRLNQSFHRNVTQSSIMNFYLETHRKCKMNSEYDVEVERNLIILFFISCT